MNPVDGRSGAIQEHADQADQAAGTGRESTRGPRPDGSVQAGRDTPAANVVSGQNVNAGGLKIGGSGEAFALAQGPSLVPRNAVTPMNADIQGVQSRPVGPTQQAGPLQSLVGMQRSVRGAEVGRTPHGARADSTPNASNAKFRAQITQGLAAALRQGRGEVSIKLSPRALGDVQVSIQVQGREVSAVLRPSTIEARALLDQTTDTLRLAMESRGLQVSRIEVEQPAGTDKGHPSFQRSTDADTPGHGTQDGARDSGRERNPAEPGRTDAGPAQDAHARSGQNDERDALDPLHEAGRPGVMYRDADGAARITMVDALA